MMWVVFLAAMLVIAIVAVSVFTKSTPPTQNIRFTSPFSLSTRNFNITSDFKNKHLQLPQIETEIKEFRERQKDVTIFLDTPVRPGEFVKFIDPSSANYFNANQFHVIKVTSTVPFRWNGNTYTILWMRQRAGHGDVTFTSKFHLSTLVWEAQCPSSNLNSSYTPADANAGIKDVASAIGDCLGIADSFAAGKNAGGIANALKCVNDFFDLGCVFSGKCKGGASSGLTNQQILDDMKIIFSDVVFANASSSITKRWDSYVSGVQTNISTQTFFNVLTESDIFVNQGVPVGIDFPNGDTNLTLRGLIYSISNYDSEVTRNNLAGASSGATYCANQGTKVLCNFINSFDTILNTFLNYQTDSANFQEIFGSDKVVSSATAANSFNASWPFYYNVLFQYVSALQDQSMYSSLRVNDKYVSPYFFLQQADNNNSGLAQTLSTFLPQLYAYYNSATNAYINNITWQEALPEAGTIENQDGNECLYCSSYNEDGYCQLYAGRSSEGFPAYYSLVNKNYGNHWATNSNGTSQSVVGTISTQYPPAAASSWTLFLQEWKGYYFPGFQNNISAYLSPGAGSDAWFCQPSTDSVLLSAVRASATTAWHEYNGYPFKLFDNLAAMGNLSCSQVPGTGEWTCTTRSTLTYIENNLTFTAGFPYGECMGSASSRQQTTGTNLMCSVPFSISINTNSYVTISDAAMSLPQTQLNVTWTNQGLIYEPIDTFTFNAGNYTREQFSTSFNSLLQGASQTFTREFLSVDDDGLVYTFPTAAARPSVVLSCNSNLLNSLFSPPTPLLLSLNSNQRFVQYSNRAFVGLVPSYSNGFPFDTSALSQSGIVKADSQMCCPLLTQQAKTCLNTSVSQSVGGDGTTSSYSRHILCQTPLSVGNNKDAENFYELAQQCSLTNIPAVISDGIIITYTNNVTPFITAQAAATPNYEIFGSLFYNTSQQSMFLSASYNSAINGGDTGGYINPNDMLNPINMFVNTGFNLVYNEDDQFYCNSLNPYIWGEDNRLNPMQTCLAAPVSSNGTCSSMDTYVVSYDFTVSVPSTFSNNYAIPASVTLIQDDIPLQLSRIPNLVQSYTCAGDLQQICGVCQGVSCLTGITYEFYSISSPPTVSGNFLVMPPLIPVSTLTGGNSYLLRVYEFLPAGVLTPEFENCSRLPHLFCATCPVQSRIAGENSWNLFQNVDTIFGNFTHTSHQVPPDWTIQIPFI